MNKFIAIIAGEPNSISSEIIFKSWKNRKNYKHKRFFIIGNIDLLNLQKKRLGYNIKFKKIDQNFKFKDLNGYKLPVYNIQYNPKKPFEKISKKSNKFIEESFKVAFKMLKSGKIYKFINGPISKKY